MAAKAGDLALLLVGSITVAGQRRTLTGFAEDLPIRGKGSLAVNSVFVIQLYHKNTDQLLPNRIDFPSLGFNIIGNAQISLVMSSEDIRTSLQLLPPIGPSRPTVIFFRCQGK